MEATDKGPLRKWHRAYICCHRLRFKCGANDRSICCSTRGKILHQFELLIGVEVDDGAK